MAELTVKKTGYDPKNRPVILIQKGKEYHVKKTLTGFQSEWTKSLKDATEIFNQKVSCSQNQ